MLLRGASGPGKWTAGRQSGFARHPLFSRSEARAKESKNYVLSILFTAMVPGVAIPLVLKGLEVHQVLSPTDINHVLHGSETFLRRRL